VGDIIEMNFEDNTFDCVVDVECIYANSYQDSQKIINDIYRILKPGGLFFMQTFMVGTTGEKTGEKLAGENNTYLNMSDGGLRQESGMIRLTSEEEIHDLCKQFSIKSIDQTMYSESNRKHEIKEWIVVSRAIKE
jgi:ubiquinone/menaquinone biosynthesis C-methylase UbiE